MTDPEELTPESEVSPDPEVEDEGTKDAESELDSEKEPEEPNESEPPEKEDEDEVEVYDSEADYLKAKGIEDIDDLDGLVDEFVRLRKTKEEAKKEISETPPNQPKEGTRPLEMSGEGKGKTVLGRGLLASRVEDLIKKGELKEDSISVAKGYATLTDGALNPLLDKVEFLLGVMHNRLESVMNNAKEGSWTRFTSRGFPKLVSRDKLDEVLQKTGSLDYERAFREIVVADPKLFSQFTKSLSKKGSGKKLTSRRFSSGRRGGAAPPTGGASYKQYLTPGGALDESKLNQLSLDKREKVIDSYLSVFEKKRK